MDEQQQKEPTLEELQAILAQREQQAMRACLNQLIELAHSQGFEIAAWPHLNPEGRVAAHWGVRRIQLE